MKTGGELRSIAHTYNANIKQAFENKASNYVDEYVHDVLDHMESYAKKGEFSGSYYWSESSLYDKYSKIFGAGEIMPFLELVARNIEHSELEYTCIAKLTSMGASLKVGW